MFCNLLPWLYFNFSVEYDLGRACHVDDIRVAVPADDKLAAKQLHCHFIFCLAI